MKKFKALMATSAILGALSPVMVAAEDDFSALMITDIGGVDDKSFNQSGWEGLTAWGEENGKEKGPQGYDYLQSNSDSDFITNLNSGIAANFDIIFGIGFKLENALAEVAEANPDQKFGIIDATVDLPNVVSAQFKDHEAAFLAGVAAASTTETNKIGFIGGVEGVILDRFEAGFVEGVKAVNPDIEVNVEYAGSFDDASLGKQMAAAMYANDIDIIFSAAGETGNGVFAEAKHLVENDPERKIWVVGVDRDQDAEGIVEVDGQERHLTLTSTLKGVGAAVKQLTEEAQAGNFEAGYREFGLEDGGVGITRGQLSDDVFKLVEEYQEKLINGEIEVPETPKN
ncbi:BMP family lipoprotein [Hutsoniella sourekii]